LFAFQASPQDLWEVVVQTVEKKIGKWISKCLALAAKIQLCTRALASTHVYYSSHWVLSKAIYTKLEKVIRSFLWAKDDKSKGFHQIN
jgi:hypothetical protein